MIRLAIAIVAIPLVLANTAVNVGYWTGFGDTAALLTNCATRVYAGLAMAKSIAGFSRPSTHRRVSAKSPLGAFFVLGRSPYGVQRGEASGPAGFLCGRSANPALAATLFRLAAESAAPYHTEEPSTMRTNLIPIAARKIQSHALDTVDARDLHSFLVIKRDFSTWIKARIKQYGFVENEDFVCSPILGSKGRGGHNAIEYHITLDMAKELAMVERNDKGREARRYFIDCERRLKQTPHPQFPPDIQKALDEKLALYTGQAHQRIKSKLTAVASEASERHRGDAVEFFNKWAAGSRVVFLIHDEIVPINAVSELLGNCLKDFRNKLNVA